MQEEDKEATARETANSVGLSAYVGESCLACWGLGRGVKATEPTRLQQIVVRPVPVDAYDEDGIEPRVEELRVATGYSSLTHNVWNETTMTDKLSASLQVAHPTALSFDCGFQNAKNESSAGGKIAIERQIRNRTYSFRLNSHDEKGHDQTKQSVNTFTFVERCLLQRIRQSRGCSPLAALPDCVLPYLEERKNEMKEKEKICEEVIKGPLGGITHFVSAIEMGGKTYRERVATTKSEQRQIEIEENISVPISIVSVGNHFSKDRSRRLTSHEIQGCERHLLHPEVKELSPSVQIIRSQEVVTSLQLMSIAVLVRHPDWSQAMRRASNSFIESELQDRPALISADRSFFLTTDSTYVTMLQKKEGDKSSFILSTTDKKEKASLVHIEILRKKSKIDGLDGTKVPGAKFLLAFQNQKEDGSQKWKSQKWYLAVGASSEGECRATLSSSLADSSRAVFRLHHPVSNKPAALSEWSTHHLAITWKGGLFKKRRLLRLKKDCTPAANRSDVPLTQSEDYSGYKASFVLASDSCFCPDDQTQFQLNNAKLIEGTPSLSPVAVGGGAGGGVDAVSVLTDFSIFYEQPVSAAREETSLGEEGEASLSEEEEVPALCKANEN